MIQAPVHVVYGGAHLFKSDTPHKLSRLAQRTFEAHTPTPQALSEVLGIDAGQEVFERVRHKLQNAVEDFRIDFEDGYGIRSDAEEDKDAEAAGLAVRTVDCPFIGLRTKRFFGATEARARRTLEIFTKALGPTTKRITVTLPKVMHTSEVAAAAKATAFDLELMVETKEALVMHDRFALPALIAACEGRCTSVHFGAYDFLSAHDVAASEQRLDHPLCDRAKELMLLQTNVRVSDGATNFLPVGDDATVKKGLKLHAQNVRRALATGIYQGWDLHPAQCVARYGALYAFFLQNKDATVARLKRFVETAAHARVVGGVFDDAATALGLVSFLLRGYDAGAFAEHELGLPLAKLRTRDFTQMI
jgi:citrate lyase beta subunit